MPSVRADSAVEHPVVPPSIRIVPESGRWTPDRHFTSVVFPAPLSPTSPSTSPRLSVEVDAVERLDRPVGLRDAARLEDPAGVRAHRTASRAALQIWSTATAAMMITPTTIFCQKSGTLICSSPL